MKLVLASLRRWLADGSRQHVARAAPDRWVVVDTETTGLDPDRDRLLAIGAVAVDGVGIVLADSFEIVVRSESSADAENIVVHGIGRAAQAAGTPPPAALTAFRDWTAAAPLVGFHTAFDRAVLRRAFASTGIASDYMTWLDLGALAAVLVPAAFRSGARSLDDWLSVFAIDCVARHNAACDALATAELLLRLRALAARDGSQSFGALLAAARRHKWLGNAD